MNFNSLEYLIFLPSAVLLYYLCPKKARNLLLLLLSYGFYMCWKAEYALLILASTVLTYACGLLIQDHPAHRRFWLALGLFSNLALLFFFKYFNFALSILRTLLAGIGLDIQSPTLELLLPVGISFYTFQALGYAIDVYRGTIRAERSFLRYALFVSFFPQLVAGPIERSENLLPQLQEVHRFSFSLLHSGLPLIVWGLFKKILIADQLAVAVNTVYADPAAFSGAQLAVATGCFAFQIYCDFSAYSDIARGSAALLGFRLMKNFRAPYLAVSVRDFWQRWHISLSTWFRDYLYFPLGGSRCTFARSCLNLLIVFLLSGLWHGAALTFVIWGLLNGLYQIAERTISAWQKKKRRSPARVCGAVVCLQRLFTFVLICLSWVFFRAGSVKDAVIVLKSLFGFQSAAHNGLHLTAMGLSRSVWLLLFGAVALLLGVDAIQERISLEEFLQKRAFLRWGVMLLLIALILIFGSYGSGYNPQDFVYFRF